MLVVLTALTGAEHESAVRELGMIPVQFFLGNEMDGSIVFIEVQWHFLDFFFNPSQICTFFGYDIAKAGMLLTGGQLRHFSGTDSSDGFFHGDRVLLGILYTLNPADCVGVALADTFAPEGIGFAFRQNAGSVQAVQGEKTWIPSAGYQIEVVVRFGNGIDFLELLRDLGVGLLC